MSCVSVTCDGAGPAMVWVGCTRSGPTPYSWVTWVQPMRVVSDDEAGLLLWHPVGSDIARLVDADGNTPHDIAVDRMRDPKLTLQSWTDYDILVLMRPDVAHAVWWLFQDGVFAGWYVNLEAPYVRRPDSVDTTQPMPLL